MAQSILRVGVLGAGRWADMAHIPGWIRNPRCHLVALCDVQEDLAQGLASKHGIGEVTTDWQALVSREDIDVIDVVTPSQTHFELSSAAVAAGKHVLCEKPVAYDYQETRRLAAEAKDKGLKTKCGFTFRYTPGIQYAKSLIEEGFVGRPFIYNGFERNMPEFIDKIEKEFLPSKKMGQGSEVRIFSEGLLNVVREAYSEASR